MVKKMNPNFDWEDHYDDDMQFRVFFPKNERANRKSVFVVNMTKEKLEVQLLQQKLNRME